MLQSIRDRATGWVAVAICFLLLLSMGLLGIRTYMNVSSVNNSVAEVNGVSISRDALGIALQRVQRQIQANTQALPSGLTQAIKSTVLQTLINNEVLNQAAVKEGYRISSTQTETIIKNMPEFQIKGVFSPERFQEIMNVAYFSPAGFFDQVSRSLVVNQPKQGIFSSSLTMPDEVRSALLLFGQKRLFSWVLLDPHWLSSQLKWQPSLSAEDLQKFYQSHSNDFFAPEQLSLEYVILSEKNLPKKSPQDSFSTLREKLANLSYEHPDNLDVVVKDLGLLIQTTPLFTREQGGKDVVSASEKVREIAFRPDIINSASNSDVIDLDPSTSIVFRVKQHLPARLLPFDAVQTQVKEKLTALAVNEKLKSLAEVIVSDLHSGKQSTNDMLQHYHLTALMSGLISRDDPKLSSSVLKTAFALPHPLNNHPSFGVGKTDKGYVVIILNEVKNPSIVDNSPDFQRMNNNIMESYAENEYLMYKSLLVKNAKIKVTADDTAAQ